MRVLVVEDHPRLAETVATVLRREGMAVDVAFDGREALGAGALADYDVVVLDRDLPGVHGDEVCRALVADGRPSRGADADRGRGARGSGRGSRHRRRRLPAQAVPPRRAGRAGPRAVAPLAARAAADARPRRPRARLRSPSRHASAASRWRSSPKEFAVLELLLGRRGRGRLERGDARASLGRRRRPVHQHGPDDGQPAAGQARRPAGDRDRHAGRLPDRGCAVTLAPSRRRHRSRLRHPQTTVRWRLTLLYGGLFLVCGAALLAITYTLVDHATITQRRRSGRSRIGAGAAAAAAAPADPGVLRTGPSPAELAARLRRGPRCRRRSSGCSKLTSGQRGDPERRLRAADLGSAPARGRVEHRAGDHGDHLRRARLGGGRTGAARRCGR